MRRLLALLSMSGLAAAACGSLPNETNVQDLRVLGVKSEPAGFLVDLADPRAAANPALEATVTALVVDPKGFGQEITYTAAGCPDYIDTITAATGTSSKLCPSPEATSQIPEPAATALRTRIIYPATPSSGPAVAQPVAMDDFQWEPTASFGLTQDQVGTFFSPTPTGIAAIDASVALNRDFGLAAIVNMTFTRGDQNVTIIKRVVYWPRLAAAEVPNQNPTMTALRFFKHRDETTGDNVDPWDDPAMDPAIQTPTLSRAAGDKLFVLPEPAAGAAEPYLLNERNTMTDVVETKSIARELLTYQFYATAGTFSPAMRESELNPFLTSDDGKVHIDSEWELPPAAAIPEGGQKVTIWVVVRDERAGTSWLRRTVNVVP